MEPKEYMQMRYEHLKQEGICAHCGIFPAEKGRVLCKACLIRQNNRTKASHKNGVPDAWPAGYFCYVCGDPIDEGKLCKKHENYFKIKPRSAEEDKEIEP